ncbi:MAG: transcription termination/antitermination protein NusG, partial [Mycobacterium sp.]|nr:transcription termination/antitermination protein NusG [Mycobacterium sp.]
MTSFEGESPSAVSDALAEAADPATVITDEAAEHLEMSTAAEAVEGLTPAEGLVSAEDFPTAEDSPTEATADEQAAPDAPGEDEEEDPAVALKKELRLKPGDWYVIHSYAGYENKVKANLETRVQNL